VPPLDAEPDAVEPAWTAGAPPAPTQRPLEWKPDDAEPALPSFPAEESQDDQPAEVEQELEPGPELEPEPAAAIDQKVEQSPVDQPLLDELEEIPSPVSPPLVGHVELADANLLPADDATPPLEALAIGDILDGHYRVIEVLETEPTRILYQVRDLQRCPRCGVTGHSPDEAFCTSCGALMDQKPVATMLQQPEANSQEPDGLEPEDHVVQAGSSYWIWREPAGPDAPQVDAEPMRLVVGMQTDTGQVRDLDEDSMFALSMASTYESVTRQLALYIVADGMGGHEGGEVASRLAIQTTSQALLRTLFAPQMAGQTLTADEIQDHIADAIRQANDAVYLERQKREIDMGTTITLTFIVDWSMYLGHVGDCRAYLWGQDGLQQLTTDHSVVAGMVAAGTILPQEIYTHPQRSVIYRCIGDQPTVEVDVGAFELDPEERLLICCDGLWEELRDEGIEDILLAEADPQTACDLMVHQANLAGGSDNISVIIVQF
jgi:serine/threonine protein phosphatase PrpC